MDDQVIATYALTDDFLRHIGHREPAERAVSDAEVLTVAIVAARTFKGNAEAAWRFLHGYGYLPRRLSRAQYNRRLHRALPLAERLFRWLGALWVTTDTAAEPAFIVDSMPFPCCANRRIRRSRLYPVEAYPVEATGGAFRGYNASRGGYFYGVKAHVVVNERGLPVEAHLTPGSHNDTGELKNLALDLPVGAVLYGDRAYGTDYATEDLLAEVSGIHLIAQRQRGSRRPHTPWEEHVLRRVRKGVETAFSLVERMLPRSIHAVTARGFEAKVFFSLLALSLGGLM